MSQTKIASLYVTHETGIVWAAVFPYPQESFRNDMSWAIYDADGRTLEFEAYSIRKIFEGGRETMHIRFRDRGWVTVLPEAQLSAELSSPSA
jgi:hypothetical protein